MLALKHHCGGDVDIDTDGIGRTIDVCRRCGVLQPGWEQSPDAAAEAAAELQRLGGDHRRSEYRRPPEPPPPPPPRAMPEPARHQEPTMAITKKCQRSGAEFKARGPAQKWCGTCPDCKAAASAASAPTKKAKAEKPETKRPPRNTGFVSPRSTRSASSVDLSGAIEKIEEQVAALDAQRERLLGAIESLRELETA